MKRQQKKIELNELLNNSGIYEAIEFLESNLELYQRGKNQYLIQLKVLEILQTIAELQYQLEDLNEI